MGLPRLDARHALALVTVVAAALLAGCGGDTPAPPDAQPPTQTSPNETALTLDEAAALAARQVRGIAQRGIVLGDPDAPVEIVEYASFDCDACAALHDRVVPDLIARHVRTGETTLEFRALVSTRASLDRALGAYAASPQRKGWEMIQLQYARANPGEKGPPLAALETPARHAAALGLDMRRWRADRNDPAWALKLDAAENVWKVAKWPGAPVFLVRRVGHLGPFVTLVQPTTLEEFEEAIDEARSAA